ncbi:hypothetical protein LTR62_001379 [Meristemomyces frigidus]|uniref:Transcription elongation factor 1 homolog n=1 Tax=Meristemomyces frigidus TaxID=1508187 RepID=A0AAN7YL29_9PEZI|nr:hypothetical protein LTR62_001379 [Meristemomyces frigidus]
MGKRKKSSRTPQGPKKREPLATTFKCPFCNHESSVTVQIDKKNHIGTLDCRQCAQHYQASNDMKGLMQPVDVYFEWVDACEEVAKNEASSTTGAEPAPSTRREFTSAGSRAGLAPGEKVTEEDRGFIDDEGAEDAEADFELEE